MVQVPDQPKRSLYLHIAALLAGLCIANGCLARGGRIENIPPYAVSPELHDLDITYFVKQDSIKITLYVINHEKLSVTCDTRYESGPDVKHGTEQNILPDKAVAFSYDYSNDNSSNPQNVILQLQCIQPDSEKVQNTAKTPVPGVKYYYEDTPAVGSH